MFMLLNNDQYHNSLYFHKNCTSIAFKKKVFSMCLKIKYYSYYKSLGAILPSFLFILKSGIMSAGSHAEGCASQHGKNAKDGRVDMAYLKFFS